MKYKIFLAGLFMLLLNMNISAQTKHAPKSKFMSYKGLVMAGYQGWFNCEGDGAERGWTHFALNNKFEDGSCKFDNWPEMDEYKVKYKTPFKFADGSPAYVFSSYDESTVDLHFKWMKEYGIDGVFMQRFFSVLESQNRLNHNDKVLASAIKAANKYGVAICLMYDIGSMDDSKYKLVMEDWKHLVDDLKLTNQGKETSYLFHNNKPLVAFWGISAGTRESGHIPEIFDIMDFFKNDPVYGGCSIHLGIPSRWRTLGSDTKGDPRLHEVIRQADVVHPWLVGRYNEENYEAYRQENIIDDVKWCKENGKSYAPTVYPGFSWHNMKGDKSDKTPRNKGEFYWKQIAGAIESGAEMIYVAMFDEIDEGTAIMKCAHNVPVGKSVFVPIEKEVPSDHYLWLTGMAGKMLRSEIPFSKKMPERKVVVKPIDPKSIDIARPTLFAVPYTHLDDMWRWSYPQVIRDFLKSTLDDNFKAFKEYPNYVFNWSGASRYQMMREYYPEKYAELKEWVAVGRWYPSGSSWVENDVNVPSSESMIRQILMGYQYFKNEFGKESREFMLPDCFGFPYSLPSVLNHCGIRGFSTQKLTWESANGIPFNVGRWIGPDGKSVIAALNAGNYAAGHDQVYSTHKETLARLEKNKELSGLPIDYFYIGGGDQNNADRGGVVQKVSLETLKKAQETKGPVNVVTGQADLMFRAITDEQAEKFPTWNKDLLLIKHSTGVLSSQAYTKKLNRDAELLADASERAAVAAYLLNGSEYPYGTLNEAWGLMLRNQFHDNLPGTSIPKAYEQGWNDGIIALNRFAGVYQDAVGTLARSLNTDVPGVPVVVFNPLSISRKDNVEAFIPEELRNAESLAVFDSKGKEVPSQITKGFDGERRILFQADLSPVGAAVYSIRQEKTQIKNSELVVHKDYLENNNFKVTIDANGDITSIFDKRINKELLEKPIQLEFGENFPDTKPAWRIYWKDIKQPARSVASNPISVKVIEEGPVRVAVEVIRENEGSRITQRIRLSAGADGSRVETANLIDWKSRGTLLKAAFHFTAHAPEATYNLDLGTIKRGNRNEKQYEVPHHAWIDLTDQSGVYGVSLLTGAKYGSDKVDDNTIRLTLIHGPDTKDSEQEVLDDGTMSEMRWQDWGRHQFTYSVTGHKGDWREGKSHWEAMRFEQHPAAFAVPKHKGMESSFSLLNINSDQVNIQAVKMAEDGSGVVVRLQELSGKDCKGVKLSASVPIEAAEEIDGTERPLDVHLATKKNVINLDFTPYELKTVLLKISGKGKMPVFTQPINLEYDTDIFSYNTDREDGYDEEGFVKPRTRSEGHRGTMDGKGGTYPAEMIGDKVQVGNVIFNIGSRKETEYNAVACKGQSVDIPKDTKVLHILAAADVDSDVIFKAGEKEFPLTIGGWTGYMGSWDNREFEGFVAELSYSMRNNLKTIHPAFIRDQRIAWAASHHHRPVGDALYEYSYLFSYRLEIPEGATNITLPNSRFVRIVAMSVGDDGKVIPLQKPFEDLHRDKVFTKRFENPNMPVSHLP